MENEPTPAELDARLAASLRRIADLLDNGERDVALIREMMARVDDIVREIAS